MLEESPAPRGGINTYNEKPLHAALKQWYAQPDDTLEMPVDGFIIDLVRGELLIEIQTGSFSPLKRKLFALVERHPVRLVFPIPQEKWIVRQPEGEAHTSRRKSPWRGRLEHVFAELVYIPALIHHPNFTLEVLLTREEETRRPDKKKGWRRKGWVIEERRLLEVVERVVFQTPADLARLLPAGLPDPFTTRQLARSLGQPIWLAGKMAYALREMGAVAVAGHKGRAALYTRISLPG